MLFVAKHLATGQNYAFQLLLVFPGPQTLNSWVRDWVLKFLYLLNQPKSSMLLNVPSHFLCFFSDKVMQAAMAPQPGQAATAAQVQQVQQVQQAQGAAAPQAQQQPQAQQAQAQAQAQPQAQQPPMMLQVDGAGDTSSEEDEDEEEEYDDEEEEEKDKDGGEDGQVEEVRRSNRHNKLF